MIASVVRRVHGGDDNDTDSRQTPRSLVVPYAGGHLAVGVDVLVRPALGIGLELGAGWSRGLEGRIDDAPVFEAGGLTVMSSLGVSFGVASGKSRLR